MPIAVSPRRSASTLVMVVAAASLAAGCSNGSSRFSPENLFAGSNAGGTGIEQRSLPPLTAGQAMGANPSINQALAAAGWTTQGAQVVEVTAADTPVSVSQGFGVPVPILLQANGMAAGSNFAPGQRVIIPQSLSAVANAANGATGAPLNMLPTGTASGLGAPPTTLNQQAAALASAAGSYRVQHGDTLFSIARRHNASMQSIAVLNNLPADGKVRSGQILKLPDGSTTPATAANTVIASAPPAATAVAPTTITDAPAASAPTAAAKQPEPVVAAPPKASGADNFRWPVRGRIIAGFGKQPDGARNDGINLAVPAGTPVKAAEAGTVIYAGNELEGYGNLVLVQHGDDWVSAYAHAETIKVSRGDRVERGQPIATAGKTGSVDEPQLHFELRRNSRPVDPLPHLAGA